MANVGTREEWLPARKALHEREQELGGLDDELAKQRSELPWVPVEKEHTFDTPDRFLVPYHYQLLDQVPSGRGDDFPLRRHDEY